jgi:hypothetical protein
MNKDTFHMIECVKSLGISDDDAWQLRRISMTLHRWSELECGNSNDSASYCLVRGVKKDGEFVYDDNGKPFIEMHFYHSNGGPKVRYYQKPDLERGALKRLTKIMARYPNLSSYVQGDPRGASLYILRPGDVPEGEAVDSYYSRGLAVYK